jgi:hypothetical protein
MHEYIIGSSGSGKTEHMKSEIADDPEAFCFIDKHGPQPVL